MSEDRDLMMQHRLMCVLEKQAPDGMVATRLAAAAKVSIENTERLLQAAEKNGIVTSFVNDDGRLAWMIAPDPVPLKDIDGSKPVEQPLVEEFAEGDLRELLHELDPFDLPDGWTLLPPWTETAEWDLVYSCEWNGESVWQVCTMPGKRQPFSFMVTDIPHPDDPDETCTFEFDMDQAVRLLGFHLVRQIEDERREASE